jgi:hypothetical protein
MSLLPKLNAKKDDLVPERADMSSIIPGTPADKAQRTAPSTRQFFRITGLLAGLMILWSLATPLMGFPDEPAHAIKAAAVSRGQIFPAPETSFGHGVHVRVPSYFANLYGQMCFAYRQDTSAKCAPPIQADDNYLTIGVTTAGYYNPLFYWIVGLPSLVLSGAPAIYAMRVTGVLLSATFYAAGFWALLRLRKPKWPVVAASVGMTPMIFFLASGINPNSLEVAATMAALCGMFLLLENARNLAPVKPALLIVGISTAVLANTRNVSLAWLLVALVVAVSVYGVDNLFLLFRNKSVLRTVLVSLVFVAVGLVWIVLAFLAPPSAGSAPEVIARATTGIRPDQAFLTMLDRSFDFVTQYIGVMGWLDVAVPQAVLLFWGMLIVLLGLMACVARPRRSAWAFWIALIALISVPALIQAGLISSVGFIWQGRYNLPLFLIVVIAAGMALRFRQMDCTRASLSFARLLVIAAAIAHIYAFMYILRRYVVGIIHLGNWQTMILAPGWQPVLGWPLLAILYTAMVYVGTTSLFEYLFPGKKLLNLPPLRRRQ